jgi:hypothetical protein
MFVPLIDQIPHGDFQLEALLSLEALPRHSEAIRQTAKYHEYILTTTLTHFAA